MALTIESYSGGAWVDITAYCPIAGDSTLGLPPLEVEQNADNHISTARFCIIGTGLDSIDAGSEVRIRIEADGVPGYQTVFAGVAAIVEDMHLTSLEDASHFQCQDYNILLEQTLVLWYTIDDGDVDSTEIAAIFAAYRPDIGTGSFVETVDGDMEVMAMTSTLREAMELICDRTGAQFYVDFDKELHYWSGQGFAAAGFQISDAPDMVLTFPCGNLRRIVDTTQMIDRVYVIGDGVAGWVGAGEYEAIVWDDTIKDAAGITERGTAIIAERAAASTYYTCVVWEDGLVAGQYINVTHAGLGLSAAEFNIRRIVMRPMSEDGALREYDLELGDNPWYEDWWSGAAQAATMTGGGPSIAPGRGYIWRSNALPMWEPHYAAGSGWALVGDGTDILSDQTPTWTGSHTWDDGAGDSPAAIFVGGSNDDTASIFLDDDAVAGDSDLIAKLCAADSGSRFTVQDSAGNACVSLAADGNIYMEKGTGGGIYAHQDDFQLAAYGGSTLATSAYFQIYGTGWSAAPGKQGNMDFVANTAGAGGWIQFWQYDGAVTWSERLIVDLAGDIEIGSATYAPAGQVHIGQESATGAQPVLWLNQADVSEQHIVASIGGADVDFPAILQLDVTGDPTLWWDESESRLIWDEHLGLSAGDLYLAAGYGIIHADGVTAGYILRADGTRYVPANPATTLPFAPTARGDMIAANATPAWARLAFPGGAGYALVTTATDPSWSTTPTWTGLHTFNADLELAEYVHHTGDADTFIRFQADNVTLQAGGVAMLDLVEGANDYINVGAAVLMNGYIIALDADDDSYLYSSADDVVDLVLAGAGGEFGITINGGEDFTFTANALNVLEGSALYWSEYAYHYGDTNTYIRFQADNITLRAGGVDLIDIVEGATDYVTISPKLIVVATDDNYTSVLDANGVVGSWMEGDPGTAYNAFSYGAGANTFSRFAARRARGTRASPSAAQSGDTLVRMGGGGYGASTFLTESTGFVQVSANQNFTDANHGTYLSLYTTPNGSTTPTERVRVGAAGAVYVNDSANGEMTVGVTINQGGADDEAFALKSSDVAHGITTWAETDTYATLKKSEAAYGGAALYGYKEAGGTAGMGVLVQGWLAENPDTTKTTAGRAIAEVHGIQASGATFTNTVADGNVMCVRTIRGGAAVTLMIVDEDGDLYIDGSTYAYDEHDDAVLAWDVSRALSGRWDELLEYGKEALLASGVIAGVGDDGRVFLSTKRTMMLSLCALGQLWQRVKALEARL